MGAFGEAIVELVLVKTAHTQRPFDRLSRAPQPECTALSGRYRNEVEINVPSRAPVDAELVQERRAAPIECGKVQKRVFDRLFHLVREGPRQKHRRGMGVDLLDRLRGRVVGLRLFEVLE